MAMGTIKTDTVTILPVPSKEARLAAGAQVEEKLSQIRQIFKEIEGLADTHRLFVVWDGLDNMDEDGWWVRRDRIEYVGDGKWRSSSRNDC